MSLGGHRLLTQIGAGRDGAAYHAVAPNGDTVELRVLDGAREVAERWAVVCQRLRRLSLVQHPGSRPVLALDLDDETPYVALAALEPARFPLIPPVSLAETVTLGLALAEALSAAHRLGVVHGSIGPDACTLTAARRPVLDFTGLRTTEEAIGADHAETTDDLAGLGRWLAWLLTGRRHESPLDVPGPLGAMIADLVAADPTARPSAWTVCDLLYGLQSVDGGTRQVEAAPVNWSGMGKTRATDFAPVGERQAPERLGRFQLRGVLGRGAMGVVYQGEDLADGMPVAVKVLRSDWAEDGPAADRFRKEARLLAAVRNPHIVNLLEANEDAGFHYMALEFVAGRSLDKVLNERGPLCEADAVALAADVARGLAEAHARGILHRDVKPENILLPDKASGGRPRAKLADFGLARQLNQTESLNLTRAGAVLGTPLYMSPEQCAGAALDARADVYSLGATLYHLMAGRPPFSADSVVALFGMHANEPPPPLRRFCPTASDGVCRVVERALAKNPTDRHADAGALLADLERLQRGEPTGLAVHPRRPEVDPRRIISYEFVWELDSAPARLWPHVSNTERLNRAIGLSAVNFSNRLEASTAGKRVRRFGEFHRPGLTIAWEEHPYEWIEGRRLGVLREYNRGPFKWLTSVVELTPHGAGTRLTHRLELEPRGLFGRAAAQIEVKGRTRRALGRVYRRIDAALQGRLADGVHAADPFEPVQPLARSKQTRLENLLDDLVGRGVDPAVAERLGEYVEEASAQDVARIRPLALAAHLRLDADAVVAACLHGVKIGLFVLLWDVLCPLCRVPSGIKDTLRLLREHEHCPACAEDFVPDFAESVELVFRVHPEVRASELATYCIGGPAHSPHVAAQARVAPGERVEIDLALSEGAYRLRGPQLPHAVDFWVQANAGVSRLEVDLAAAPDHLLPRTLRPGGQVFALSNSSAGELVVRVERTAPRADALTAARASSLALFRELFPGEVLAPGQLVSVATVTLLVTALADDADLYTDLGDARAFEVIHELFRILRERVRDGGGAVVKTSGEGVIAAFQDAVAAVKTALSLQSALRVNPTTRSLNLRVAVHRGSALAATVNEHLDYFGTTARQAMALPALADGGELVMTRELAADPGVAPLVRKGDWFTADIPGVLGAVLYRAPLS